MSFKPSVTDMLRKTCIVGFVLEKTWRIRVKRRRLRMINKLMRRSSCAHVRKSKMHLMKKQSIKIFFKVS